MSYYVVEQRKGTKLTITCICYESLEDANKMAEMMWASFTKARKEKVRIFVGSGTQENMVKASSGFDSKEH